jgi:hypothetical protein
MVVCGNTELKRQGGAVGVTGFSGAGDFGGAGGFGGAASLRLAATALSYAAFTVFR